MTRSPAPTVAAAALLLLAVTAAGAAGPLRLTDARDVYAVGSHLEILTWQDGQRTIDEVAAPAMAGAFAPNAATRVSLRFSPAGHWARLRVVDESAHVTRWILSIRGTQVSHLDLYTPSEGEGFKVWRTGAALPFASRELPDRRFAFRLPARTGAPARPYTVYLRLSSNGPIVFEPWILSSEAFVSQGQETLFGLGLFYGAMLVAIVVHLCTFLLVREPSYLFYAVFVCVCVLGLGHADGLLQQLAWPHDRVLSPKTMLFLLGLFAPSACAFGASFLHTRRYLPRTHKWILVLIAAAAAGMALFPFVPAGVAAQLFRLLSVLAALTVAGAGVALWRKGHRPAGYFSIAWLAFIATFLVSVSGARPSAADASIDLAYLGLHVSVALTTLVFALALADGLRWQRSQAVAEREGLIRELEERNAKLGRFAYSVSHDLKTPLVTIKGFLGWLARDLAAGKRQQVERDVAFIDEAAEKMRLLLDDLIELTRVGRVVNPPEDVPLGPLFAEVLELVAERVDEAGAVVRVASDLPAVYGDRARLREVFHHLVENAVKFSRGETPPRVEVGAVAAGNVVRCHVSDNGVGIPRAYHDKVFGLFERLDPRAEGTGVGLALVKRIVEEHGGEIWVESEGPGKGTTFRLRLPRGASSAKPRRAGG